MDENKNFFELPAEVLKSRRNLLIVSFLSIATIILAPEIICLKLFGAELTLLNNFKLKALMLGTIVVETVVFLCRYNSSGTAITIKYINEKEQKIQVTIRLDGMEPIKLDPFTPQLSDSDAALKDVISKSKHFHNISEVILPLAVAATAILSCLQDIMRDLHLISGLW